MKQILRIPDTRRARWDEKRQSKYSLRGQLRQVHGQSGLSDFPYMYILRPDKPQEAKTNAKSLHSGGLRRLSTQLN